MVGDKYFQFLTPNLCTCSVHPRLILMIMSNTQEADQHRLHSQDPFPSGLEPGLTSGNSRPRLKRERRKRSEYLFLDSQLLGPLWAALSKCFSFVIPLTSLSSCHLQPRGGRVAITHYRAGDLLWHY